MVYPYSRARSINNQAWLGRRASTQRSEHLSQILRYGEPSADDEKYDIYAPPPAGAISPDPRPRLSQHAFGEWRASAPSSSVRFGRRTLNSSAAYLGGHNPDLIEDCFGGNDSDLQNQVNALKSQAKQDANTINDLNEQLRRAQLST
eukprot:726830_1